jgi:Mg-chelatase subunit ChlD
MHDYIRLMERRGFAGGNFFPSHAAIAANSTVTSMKTNLLVIALVTALTSSAIVAGGARAASSDDTNLMLIFDASGSMKKKLESGETRLDTAKKAMSDVLQNMEEGINLGLTMYGHRVRKQCTDIELVTPIGSEDPASINRRVQGVEAKGETPIADSIKYAVKSFKAFKGANNRVLLVTDGIEECGGNVCEAAQFAKDADVDIRIDVIGFKLSGEQQNAISCIPKITGGKYYDATDASELNSSLKKATKKKADQSKDYKDAQNNKVTLGLGDRAFVDSVVSVDAMGLVHEKGSERPEDVLGVPNYDSFKEDYTYYTLGCKGTGIWRFDDNYLVDGPGADLYIFEIGANVEPMTLAISIDGKEWRDVGPIPGGKGKIDISPVAKPGEKFRYVKLTDSGSACGNSWPGADIDAIGAVNSEERDASSQ